MCDEELQRNLYLCFLWKPAINNKDIYNINFLLQYKVKFEELHVRHEVPQGQRWLDTSDMVTHKISASDKRDESNMLKTTLLSNVQGRQDFRILFCFVQWESICKLQGIRNT